MSFILRSCSAGILPASQIQIKCVTACEKAIRFRNHGLRIANIPSQPKKLVLRQNLLEFLKRINS
jgi:hypothetical protein